MNTSVLESQNHSHSHYTPKTHVMVASFSTNFYFSYIYYCHLFRKLLCQPGDCTATAIGNWNWGYLENYKTIYRMDNLPSSVELGLKGLDRLAHLDRQRSSRRLQATKEQAKSVAQSNIEKMKLDHAAQEVKNDLANNRQRYGERTTREPFTKCCCQKNCLCKMCKCQKANACIAGSCKCRY